jgi:hypothetical protein
VFKPASPKQQPKQPKPAPGFYGAYANPNGKHAGHAQINYDSKQHNLGTSNAGKHGGSMITALAHDGGTKHTSRIFVKNITPTCGRYRMQTRFSRFAFVGL